MTSDAIPNEPGPQQPSLDNRQRALYEALAEKPGVLAQMYRGAILVLHQETNSERFALAAHNLRELMEKIPTYVDVKIKTQISLKQKVQELREAWIQWKSNTSIGSDPPADKDRKLLRITNDFFDWYELDNSTRTEQAKEFFRKVDPANLKIPEVLEDKNADIWFTIRGYFLGVAHHKKEPTEQEFMKYLFQMERILLDSLLPRTFDEIKEIDKLIEPSK